MLPLTLSSPSSLTYITLFPFWSPCFQHCPATICSSRSSYDNSLKTKVSLCTFLLKSPQYISKTLREKPQSCYNLPTSLLTWMLLSSVTTPQSSFHSGYTVILVGSCTHQVSHYCRAFALDILLVKMFSPHTFRYPQLIQVFAPAIFREHP